MFILLCSCGCDNGFIFKELDGNIYVSTVSSDFYNYQGIGVKKLFYRLSKNIKEYNLVKHHKKNILKETFCNKENIQNLLTYLESQLPTLNNEKINNITKLRIKKDIIEECNYTDYSIELLTATTNAKEIFFKTHRKYDIVLNKKETLKLIKSCKKALE